ncbi:MAG: hypothetical protein QM723_10940 [Myxococcaceae bacterium]
MRSLHVQLTLSLAVALLAPSAGAQIKVACAGEHSTQSAYVADDQEYPARLQRFLGDGGWEIRNFAYRRATVQTTGPSLYPASTPYLQTVEFQASLAYAPDVVVLGPFGRHDCDMNYTDAGSIDPAGFLVGLRNIVDAYQALPKKPRILIALPIPYAWGNGDEVMSHVVLPITQQVAAEYGLQEIDHWTPYYGHPEIFTPAFDTGDHFDDAGMDQMALTVMAALLYDGGIDSGVIVADPLVPGYRPDAGQPDAGPADSGAPDAGPADSGQNSFDASVADAGTLPVSDGMLHPAASGCSAAPGFALMIAVALALLRLRRARAG